MIKYYIVDPRLKLNRMKWVFLFVFGCFSSSPVKGILFWSAQSEVVSFWTPLYGTPAARAPVHCLTKPPWFDCASRTCAAVMAARESEEDNKWTPEKRLKGKTRNITTSNKCGPWFYGSMSVSAVVSCRLGLQVCFVESGWISWLHTHNTRTHTYTHTGQ